MSITERSDVHHVFIIPHNDDDGGLAYLIGFDGVTSMRIVARHGPLDFIPYIEVWKGNHLHAEVPQHQTLSVEFARAKQ
jgi:hypothetical protein